MLAGSAAGQWCLRFIGNSRVAIPGAKQIVIEPDELACLVFPGQPVIDALPGDLREQTKSFLSQSLKAVVTQVLVKTPDGRGRKAAMEILVNNRAIAKLIMTDQSHQIPAQLQMGRDVGMQMMDQALLAAIEAKEVDPDDAFRYAHDKKQFQRFVTDSSILPVLDEGGNAQAG